MANPILTYKTRSGDVTNATGLGVVFLSYRKKNVIYRNDVARDILDANECAVWFDRNLTAGEDYNAEIDAALERMNVFVLLVTPATFEPGCYVMTKEIPRALERKIPIIPIILEETDMGRFAEVLGDIHALDKRKPDEYEDGLKRALAMHLLTKDEKEKIHMAQKEDSARAAKTLYYQGLGWLTGENCERDPQKGVQMITAVAMSGEAPEALLRLAQMYETGDGVTRDWQQAVGWYDKYAAAMEPHFGKNEDDDLSLAWAYDSKGSLLQSYGKLTAAKAAFTSYQQVCQRMMTRYDGRQERQLSISYERLGDICTAQGDLSGAKDFYNKSLTIYENLAKDSDDYLAKRAPTVIYNRLGDICKAQGDLSGAKDYYLKALAISERLAAESETTEAQRDLSISYNRLGDICKAQGDLSGAKDYYLKDLAISERLAAESETTQAQRDLSVSYERLGDICTAQGDLSGARDYYLKALAIRERLAAESEGTQAKDDLAVSYYKIGTFEGTDRNERIGYLQKAKAIWADLAQATGIDEYRRRMNIAESLIHEAQTSASSGQAPAPKKFHLAGKIIGALLVATIVALVALQLTGVMDILGWLKGLFG